ncbi:GreA/GreB family elongation factor [Patescibacteria group bacterium]|nr:GreA/GreB family elongation factor [Patescibacteria group bacterium]
MSISVTQRAIDALLKSRKNLFKELKSVRNSMDVGAKTGDGWHDEGFKIGIGDEKRIASQISAKTRQISLCNVITPEEQNDIVKIGNVVEVKYLNDNTKMIFVVDGVASYEDVCSADSPLGRELLMGKKMGDVINIEGTDISIRIEKIFLPSYYSTFKQTTKDP